MNRSSASPPPVLQLQDVLFAYPGQPALAAQWSASIGAGVTLLHGDTGSGKTALLRVLAGRLPASGRLAIAGTHLGEDAAAYRRQLFFVEPETDAYDAVTARACSTSLHADDAQFDAARWQALVEGFALTPHIDKPMYMLSTGSKRKVWLACALASGRPLVLLDEPTGALDAASIRCLWRTLAECAQERHRAILVASSERIAGVPLAGTIELPLG